ncbi:MAG: hypothetical protein HQ494_12075 [Rhodospirillales bacterium]|nr:hypothetical protein [Rhodospirillales bacterium]
MAETDKNYSYYREKHTLFEGDVVVYRRPKLTAATERERATQERWQMQLKIPGQHRITKSTKTGNLGDAMSIAKETYMKMRQRAEQGLPLTDMNFKTFFESEWMPRAKTTLSIHRVKVHQSIGARYMGGFFGGYELAKINEVLLDKYWEWRWTYWTHGPGLDDKTAFYTVDRPSPSTLRQEKGVLNQILKYAKRRGYINTLPIIAVPSMEGKQQRNRKGRETTYFDEDDYKKLYLFLAEWQHGGRHKLHRFQRKMLRYLIMFLLNSGLRPNEAWQLTWKDIIPTRVENGDDGRYAGVSVVI